MAEQQEVLANLLESFPLAELSEPDHRQMFLGIKNRLLAAMDVQQELKTLYRVSGFSEFAAALLWVLDRMVKTPDVSGISMEDETLLLSAFRHAAGEQLAEPAAMAAAEGEGSDAEKSLSSALDKFTEAVQGGTDERESLHASLLSIAEGPDLQAIGGETAQLGSLLAEFLKYIGENQLFDDIRVINTLSNISSSVAQWVTTPADGRPGLLDESLGLLKDFKSQFE